MKNIQIKRKKF